MVAASRDAAIVAAEVVVFIKERVGAQSILGREGEKAVGDVV